MKNSKSILFVLYNLIYLVSFSQNGEFVIKIDRTTGTFIKTGPAIAGITYIYPDDRTYDENTGTFIFPSAQINHALYSIDVSNGSIVNNPIINNIKTFEFDNVSNILYGLEPDNGNSVKNFIAINTVTGAYTQIGNSLPGSSTFSGGFSTFNKTNHIYIFLAPPNILYSINAANGSVISNPSLSLATGENIVNFSFDNSSGILYGLLQDNTVQKFFLVTINTTTGINTRIGSGTTLGYGNGSSTIDEANQQYIYMYSNSGGYAITTLDISTGNVIYNNFISPLNGVDNVFSLKYDNIQGKLYSIHWGPIDTFTVTSSQTNALCNAQCSGTATAITTGGISPFTYNWSSGQTTQTATALCAGTHSVTITDSTNYSATATVTITEPAAISLVTTTTNTCAGDSTGSIAVNVSGGTSPYAYNWSNGSAQSQISNLTSQIYSVTVTDNNGCSDSTTANINATTAPLANAETDTIICEGENTIIGATGLSGYYYIWQPTQYLSSAGIAQPTASPVQTITYILTVNDTGNVCPAAKDTVVLSVVSKPTANAGINVSVCKGGSAVVGTGGASDYEYQWQPQTWLSNAVIAQPIAMPQQTTEYILIVLDTGNYCTPVQDSVTVSVINLPISDAGSDKTICKEENEMLGAPAIAGYKYHWQPATGLSDTTSAQPTTSNQQLTTSNYQLTVADTANLCPSDTDSVSISVIDCDTLEPNVFLPDIFSPNADGVNDVLFVRGAKISKLHLAIYDRWGEQVFETNTQANGWAGTYKGKPMNTGVFVYVLKVIFEDGKTEEQKGNVTLVR